MENYQKRVIEEKDQLLTKLSKLTMFLAHDDTFNGLPKEEQDLLRNQKFVMGLYADILQKRIEIGSFEIDA